MASDDGGSGDANPSEQDPPAPEAPEVRDDADEGSAGPDEAPPATPSPAPDSATAFKLAYASRVRNAEAVPPLTLEPSPGNQRILLLVGLVAAGLLLYFGRPVLMPVALAVLLSFLLSPMAEWMEHRRVPRVASTIVVVTLAFLLLGGLGWAVFNGVTHLGNNIERIGQNLGDKIDRLSMRSGNGTIERVQQTVEDVVERAGQGGEEAEAATTQPQDAGEPDSTTDQVLLYLDRIYRQQQEQEVEAEPPPGQVPERPLWVAEVPSGQTPLERAGYILTLAAGPAGTAGLVMVFTFFILLQRDDLRDRMIRLAAGRQLNLATQALDDAATRISRYLRAMAVVNGTYGLAIGIGLEAMALLLTGEHFPSVWLWALLCATLRFIPYLGPWIAASFPIIVSVGWWPGYEMFLATAIYIIVIEILSNNVMEPLLYGSSTGMSPVAIILAAVFWTFVWGPIGLLLATPLTTVLVVLGKYVPALRFFDILLGADPVLPPHSRLYQRMLALDADDAQDVVEEFRESHTLTETFDQVLMPALCLSERDRHAGHLTAERTDFINVVMREIAQDLGTQQEPLPADSVDLASPPPPGERQARVLILPSVDQADEAAALMLKYLLDRRGLDTTVTEAELTSEKLEQVFAEDADVVVISAMPPRASARARYLVKRLRQAQVLRGQKESGRAAAAIVGLWTVSGPSERAAQRLREHGLQEVNIVSTLAQGVEAVRQRAQVIAARRTAEEGGAGSASPRHSDVA